MEEEPVEVVVGVLLGDEEDSATEEGEEEAEAVEAVVVASVQVEEGLEAVIQISRELVALVEAGVRFTCTSVWAEGIGSSRRFILSCIHCIFNLGDKRVSQSCGVP